MSYHHCEPSTIVIASPDLSGRGNFSVPPPPRDCFVANAPRSDSGKGSPMVCRALRNDGGKGSPVVCRALRNDGGKGSAEGNPSAGGLGVSPRLYLFPPLLEERGPGGEVNGASGTPDGRGLGSSYGLTG
jgi:hypothetical protein